MIWRIRSWGIGTTHLHVAGTPPSLAGSGRQLADSTRTGARLFTRGASDRVRSESTQASQQHTNTNTSVVVVSSHLSVVQSQPRVQDYSTPERLSDQEYRHLPRAEKNITAGGGGGRRFQGLVRDQVTSHNSARVRTQLPQKGMQRIYFSSKRLQQITPSTATTNYTCEAKQAQNRECVRPRGDGGTQPTNTLQYPVHERNTEVGPTTTRRSPWQSSTWSRRI